jgi:hypothetical protein
MKRVDGNQELEPLCRKLFFTTSYLIFDTQLTLCASIISMAPSVNQEDQNIRIASVVFAPIFMGGTLIWFLCGYWAVSFTLKFSVKLHSNYL